MMRQRSLKLFASLNIFIILGFFSLFLGGCSVKFYEKNIEEQNQFYKLDENISYDIGFYSKQIEDVDFSNQLKKDKEFNEKYFLPWRIEKFSYDLNSSKWAIVNYLEKRQFYGENKKPLSPQFVKKIIQNANFDKFDTLRKKAIILRSTQFLNFPSDKPFYKNFEEEGEGYPFDYSLNTFLKINEPLFVSHLSLDGAWAFCQSSYAAGWVFVKDIGFVEEAEIEIFMKNRLGVVVKDGAILEDMDKNFISFLKIGTIFSIINEKKDYYTVLYASLHASGNSKKAAISKTQIKKEFLSQKPLQFSKKNIEMVSKEFLGEKYGWGGFLNNRDCSMMTRDFFSVFGVWLPRNSAAQKNWGKFYDISNLDKTEKEIFILQNAKPFETIIYKKGHVMIYAGKYNNRAIVFHNMWGLKTKNLPFSRFIVGQSGLSSLWLGAENQNVDEENILIEKISSFVNVFDF